jgi:phosphoglycerate dehydrogenase-like enzyme
MTSEPLTIVSYSTQNPERQGELRLGAERIMGDRPFKLIFAQDEAAACKALHDAQVLYLPWNPVSPPPRGHGPILLTWVLTEDMFRAAPKLEWVHLGVAGVERSLFPAVIESDVVITNARGVHGPQMAEWVLAVLLHISQQMGDSEEWRHDRQWKLHKEAITRTRFILRGHRALIVGFGSIGEETAKLLSAIGVECEGVVTHLKPATIPLHVAEELPAIIGGFDIVVIAVPYTPATDKLFTRQLFQKMKPGSILVNLARGRILDEAALIDALKNGPLGYAALDVFQTEPLPEDSPLFDLRNLVMTPHIAGNFPDYTKKVNESFLNNLERFVSGMPLNNVVDKRRGY